MSQTVPEVREPAHAVHGLAAGAEGSALLAAAKELAAERGAVSVRWAEGPAGLPQFQILAALETELAAQGRRVSHEGMTPEVRRRWSLCGLPHPPGAGDRKDEDEQKGTDR